MIARRGKFFWKLFLGNALLLVVAVGACVLFISRTFERIQEEDLTVFLRTQARSFATHVRPLMEAWALGEPDALSRIDAMVREVGSDGVGGFRVTVVYWDGVVLGDSAANAAEMELHNGRPEILEAMMDGWGKRTRWSHTVQREMRYVAVRVGEADDRIGVVRFATGIPTLEARQRSLERVLWSVAGVSLLGAVVLALGLALMWSEPIARLTETARNISEGDLSARVEVRGSDELSELATSLNQMRQNLAVQLEQNYRQRRTLEYLLAQLQEGVIVADGESRIVLINPTAARLLDIPVSFTSDGRGMDGLTVEKSIPQHVLQVLLRASDGQRVVGVSEVDGAFEEDPLDVDSGVMGGESLEEARLTLKRGEGSVTILARALDIVLPGTDVAAGAAVGTEASLKPEAGRLLVLTDITALTRSIQVKTDFVANASHELRTPLAAIRGAAETLMGSESVVGDERDRRLLHMIDRHSRRLESMVNDLLSLSRLESTTTGFDPGVLQVSVLMQDLSERYDTALGVAGLTLDTDCVPEQLSMVVSGQLLEMALCNLIENAIKFSDRGGVVRVRARLNASDGVVLFEVEDEGCGISEADQSRVFERFFQVGRSRSGAERGTGLGLAIVRHSVAVLQGTVELESALGVGTTVRLRIPQGGC